MEFEYEVTGRSDGISNLRMKTCSGGLGAGVVVSDADKVGMLLEDEEGNRLKCCEFKCAEERSRPYVASGRQYSISPPSTSFSVFKGLSEVWESVALKGGRFRVDFRQSLSLRMCWQE
jgi:hypothetical protein